MVVTLRIADGISTPAFTLSDFTSNRPSILRGRGDVPALPSIEGVVEDVAKESVEVGGAGTAEERSVVDRLASAPVVAGVGEARRVHPCLALVPTEARWTETARTQVTGDAGGTVTAAQGAAGMSVIFAGGARVTLRENHWLARVNVHVIFISLISSQALMVFMWC